MTPIAKVLLAAVLGAAAVPSAAAPAAPIAPQRLVADVPPVVDDDAGAAVQDEAEEDRAAQLGLPDPRRYAPASPERAAAEYLDAWHDRAWDRMALWSTAGTSGVRSLRAVDRLRGWTLLDVDRAGDTAFADVLTARRGMRPVLRRQGARLVLARTSDGRWRIVDP